ncbi:phosphate acyltransferase PlsX, partial [Candidatus Marinamargulisbacteria bacterium SCGC AAA071-K20]
MIKIALDAMGGDCGPKTNIAGAILATKAYPIEIILVGDKDLIDIELSKHSKSDISKLHLRHASEVIETAESPTKAFRKKKDSSIHVGLNLVKDKQADGFVSTGNTGAVLAASTFILGRSKDIERPGLAGIFPSKTKPFVILDLGSNVDCKPQHLVEFAIMGDFFAQFILERENPKIGLLSIGEEKDKGNALTQATFPLLESLPFNFIGNIEAKEITLGKVDVVVCDGFVGNNMLKFGEGISKLFSSFFKEEADRSLLSK